MDVSRFRLSTQKAHPRSRTLALSPLSHSCVRLFPRSQARANERKREKRAESRLLKEKEAQAK